VTTRLPGRIDASRDDVRISGRAGGRDAGAEAAYGEHEKRTGAADPGWPDWYAAHMVAEQAGTELPT
jgi:hypothetical protein